MLMRAQTHKIWPTVSGNSHTSLKLVHDFCLFIHSSSFRNALVGTGGAQGCEGADYTQGWARFRLGEGSQFSCPRRLRGVEKTSKIWPTGEEKEFQ